MLCAYHLRFTPEHPTQIDASALGAAALPQQLPFASRKVDDLVHWLVAKASNKTMLISWHYGGTF
jgi:hypothetical protein